MSDGQKFVFVGLGLLALLAGVALVYGQSRPQCKESPLDCAKQYSPKGGIKGLGVLFASAGAQVKLSQNSFTVAPGAVTHIVVPSIKKGSRTLTLQLQSGQGVTIDYFDNTPDQNPVKDAQGGELPRQATAPDEEPITKTSFSVSRGGGSVQIRCRGASDCQVVVP